MAGIDERLRLNDEDGAGFPGFGAAARVEIREPNLAALHSISRSTASNSALTAMLPPRTFCEARANRWARARAIIS